MAVTGGCREKHVFCWKYIGLKVVIFCMCVCMLSVTIICCREIEDCEVVCRGESYSCIKQ